MSHRRKLKDKKKRIKLQKEIQMSIANSGSSHHLDNTHSSLINEFSKIDQKELLSTIAGLSLLPENQNHYLGLLTALRIAASCKAEGGQKTRTVEEISQIITEEIVNKDPINYLEDPPADIFTDVVEFMNGNCVVYPGGGFGEAFVLRNLLKAALQRNENYSNDFIGAARSVSLSLLAINKEIVRRANHERYMDGKSGFSKHMVNAPHEASAKYNKAVTFTESEINHLLSEYRLSVSGFTPLITEVGHDIFKEMDPSYNPLVLYPVIKIGDSFVINPSTITSSLIHFIVMSSLIYHQDGELSKNYREYLWYEAVNELLSIGAQ